MEKKCCDEKLRCKVGGQAIMEGVMMKSPKGIAMAVRKSDGSIISEYTPCEPKTKKGTFAGLPIVRGVVSFVDSLSTGMKTITRSAELYGEDLSSEEPSKFEKFLSEKLGKSVEDVAIFLGVVLALALSVFLFVYLPVQGADLILHNGYTEQIETLQNSISSITDTSVLNTVNAEIEALKDKSYNLEIWRSLLEGAIRLVVFIGYILLCSLMKDVKRVFMYHGAEHKTISCYEAGDELTPESAMKHSRLHPRCGTNYLFLVMAISILIFTLLSAIFPLNIANAVLRVIARLGIRILLLPLVAGVAFEVLQAAAKSDNILCKIVRAPGMGLQLITTREPTPDMIEVALHSFKLAMHSIGEDVDIPYIENNESEENTEDAQGVDSQEESADESSDCSTQSEEV
ncbi:MAG: DUF1385 domain-containing protein [Clostridia bacterium]|nr:DUF1385 domain-containing protein [Clostridia bacterium]